MANESIGRIVDVGVAPESSRGSYQAPTFWIPKQDASIAPKTEEIEDENSVGRIEVPLEMKIGKEWSEGDISGNIRTESIGAFLKATFGTVDTTTDSPEAGANTHVFTVNNTNICPSLTVVTVDSVNTDVYVRSMINTLSIEAALDNYIPFTAGIVANKVLTETVTPSYTQESVFRPEDIEVKFATSVAGLPGASETIFESLSLVITKNAEPFFNLGTTLPSEIFNKAMIVEGSLTRLFDGNTERNYALTNSTTDAMSIKLSHADDVIGVTSTAPSLDVVMMGADFREWEPERSNDDMIRQTIAFKGFYSLGEAGMIKATLINGTTSY